MSIDWEEGFKKIPYISTTTIGAAKYFERRYVRTEDIYQLFKARWIDEIHAETEHGDVVIITTNSDDNG